MLYFGEKSDKLTFRSGAILPSLSPSYHNLGSHNMNVRVLIKTSYTLSVSLSEYLSRPIYA